MKTSRIDVLLFSSVTTALVLLLLTTFVGCASDTSYDRHNLSRLWLSQDGKQLFFDATASTRYPEDSSEAEAARMSWLNDWLELRKFCTGGHRVADRRSIRADEYNPQRHDLRYTVVCQ